VQSHGTSIAALKEEKKTKKTAELTNRASPNTHGEYRKMRTEWQQDIIRFRHPIPRRLDRTLEGEPNIRTVKRKAQTWSSADFLFA